MRPRNRQSIAAAVAAMDADTKSRLVDAHRAKVATVPLEDEEQRLFFRLVKEHEPEYPAFRFVYACPNGGTRNPKEARLLVAGGVKRGVPDTAFPLPVGRFMGWFGELKRINGVPSDLSDDQRDYLAFLSRSGYRAEWHKGGRAMFADLLAYVRGEIE